jgi:hypothetical protein
MDRKPFYVEWLPNYNLVNKIVEWEADPNNPNSAPTFDAYKVKLKAEGVYQLRFIDDERNVITGSERYVIIR